MDHLFMLLFSTLPSMP